MSSKLFLEKFAELADAPNGVSQLRDLIVQLAVRGRLVLQDVDDEPAAELIDRIRANRESTTGQQKWQPNQHTTPEDVPYVLPKGWVWIHLGTLFEFAYGKSLPANARNGSGQYPVYGSNGIVGYHDDYLVRHSALVIGRKGSIGAVNLAQVPFWPIDTTYYVVPPDGVDLLFSYYLIKSLDLARFDKATAIPGLNRQDAYNLLVGLPPLAEQRRIVAKVDELMALCDELEARQQQQRTARSHLNAVALEQLLAASNAEDFAAHWHRVNNNFDLLYDAPETIGKLRQAILQLAIQGKLVPQDDSDEPAAKLLEQIRAERERLIKVGELKRDKPLLPIEEDEQPFKLPSGWAWAKLGQVVRISTGYAFQSQDYAPDGTFILRVTNIAENGTISRDDAVYIPDEKITSRIRGYYLTADDILIVMVGGSLGKIGFVTADLLPALLNQNMWRINPIGNGLETDYLILLLRYINAFQLRITHSTHGHLAMGEYIHQPLGIPPLAEQRRIIEKVDYLMALCNDLEAKLQDAQKVRSRLVDALVLGVLQQEYTTA